MNHQVTRWHEISCGHRVFGHESKCARLHGHGYKIHFTVEVKPDYAKLDSIGRVIDFGVIKTRLCEWLEDNWDHRFLLWDKDPYSNNSCFGQEDGIVLVPFNPTAENMAQYLCDVIGPERLPRDVRLVKVIVEETSKCQATYEVEQ